MRTALVVGWPDEATTDRCIHWIGIAAGATAVIALLSAAAGRDRMIVSSVAVYGAALLAMLVCSALYHLTDDMHRRPLYQRLDHAAIFALIAGTYTPFTMS